MSVPRDAGLSHMTRAWTGAGAWASAALSRALRHQGNLPRHNLTQPAYPWVGPELLGRKQETAKWLHVVEHAGMALLTRLPAHVISVRYVK